MMCAPIQFIPTCPFIAVQHDGLKPDEFVEAHEKYDLFISAGAGADIAAPSRTVATVAERKYMVI